MNKAVLKVGTILFLVSLVGWLGGASREAYDEAYVQANCAFGNPGAPTDCWMYRNEILTMASLSTLMLLVCVLSVIVIVVGLVIKGKDRIQPTSTEAGASDDRESPPSVQDSIEGFQSIPEGKRDGQDRKALDGPEIETE